MKISDDLAKKLLDISEKVVCSAISAIYEYQKTSTYIPSYYNYPEIFFKGIEEQYIYKEMKEKIPAFKCGIPLFTMTNYNCPKKYGDLLKSSDGQFSINCHSLECFDELLKFFSENEEANKMFVTETKYIESAAVHYIGNIVNRYLYLSNNFQEGQINVDLVKELIVKQIIRYFSETLDVNICIPICFLDFEADEIEINDMISINRMSKEFQMSRFNATRFESTQESHVVQCAAFMIKMKGYHVENKEKDSLHNAIANYWSYPTEIIDDLFAAIRIAVGFNTGYGQLLIEPIDWGDEWTTDLLPVYGAQIRAFNRNEVETKFFQYNIDKVTNENTELIKELFQIIREKRADKKNGKSFKKVFIAIQRLNRCMLREAYDDTALDAIIGIETLLSGDTHGEITYTISNRISVVAAKLETCPYTSQDARKAMKTIYGFRSDIVHGRETDKNSKIVINGKERQTKELAVEFLRYSLLFVMKNQEFLEVRQFESALDEAIEK